MTPLTPWQPAVRVPSRSWAPQGSVRRDCSSRPPTGPMLEATSCSEERRPTSSATSPSGCSSTRSTSTSRASSRVASATCRTRWGRSSRGCSLRSPTSDAATRRDCRASATGSTAPCENSWSDWRPPSRWCSSWTTSTGPTQPRWTCSAACSAVLRPRPCCSSSPPVLTRVRHDWPARSSARSETAASPGSSSTRSAARKPPRCSGASTLTNERRRSSENPEEIRSILSNWPGRRNWRTGPPRAHWSPSTESTSHRWWWRR
jgi:hypothetical protein